MILKQKHCAALPGKLSKVIWCGILPRLCAIRVKAVSSMLRSDVDGFVRRSVVSKN